MAKRVGLFDPLGILEKSKLIQYSLDTDQIKKYETSPEKNYCEYKKESTKESAPPARAGVGGGSDRPSGGREVVVPQRKRARKLAHHGETDSASTTLAWATAGMATAAMAEPAAAMGRTNLFMGALLGLSESQKDRRIPIREHGKRFYSHCQD